ncbi:hypothetical protein ACWOB1_05640 [Facklamia languida]|uniref:CAAX amino terminal protease n=1 Tax=Facklamia languida CCUG 37842 TaxID=883113 RepID=H3NJS8_9LACT|nr:hypothetical protein [Facklamia languida]EHR36891.1 hypothetical protein HMPREF9708_01117 [Facklamia languida CCUG 37842]
MLNSKNRLAKVWLELFIFILVIFLTSLNYSPEVAGQNAWSLIQFYTLGLSLHALWRLGLPQANSYLKALPLGLLVGASYIDTSLLVRPVFDLAVLMPFLVMGGYTFICSLSFFRLREVYPSSPIAFFNNKPSQSVAYSLLIGLVSGLVLGGVNLLIAQEPLHFQGSIHPFILSLSPGIMEEIGMRTSFYVHCLVLIKNQPLKPAENRTLWAMMLLPHTLIHLPSVFIQAGFSSGMLSLVLLVLLFGLPFAWLQRRVSLLSACLSHWLVDTIRFLMIGLPI